MVISVLSSQETEFIKDNIADLGKASVKSSVFFATLSATDRAGLFAGRMLASYPLLLFRSRRR